MSPTASFHLSGSSCVSSKPVASDDPVSDAKDYDSSQNEVLREILKTIEKNTTELPLRSSSKSKNSTVLSQLIAQLDTLGDNFGRATCNAHSAPDDLLHAGFTCERSKVRAPDWRKKQEELLTNLSRHEDAVR
ncbi:hypothetical protein DPMN_083211 [Dreissena polymorpha]|uniref:Uncharacterized protein n=1 Tax=Dreissena polymorpha TaxID=45954 RepID=A0A9D4BJK8_DREPO|nr:hypothetical protein DPMN_083211 [Dreissena polymorpha]